MQCWGNLRAPWMRTSGSLMCSPISILIFQSVTLTSLPPPVVSLSSAIFQCYLLGEPPKQTGIFRVCSWLQKLFSLNFLITLCVEEGSFYWTTKCQPFAPNKNKLYMLLCRVKWMESSSPATVSNNGGKSDQADRKSMAKYLHVAVRLLDSPFFRLFPFFFFFPVRVW